MEAFNRPKGTRSRAAGFTIAELVAALSVVAIVSAVATPIAAKWRDHYAFTSATRQMTFEIGRARMQAIGQNAFVRLRMSGTDRFVRERSEDGATYTADEAVVELPDTMSAFILGGTPSFNRQGLANSDTWIVLIDYNAEGYAVLHSNVLGRVNTTVTMW